MMWHVGDDGRVEVRLRAEGEQAIKVARAKADQYVANIVSDLAVTLGVDALLDELRYSFSKTRPEVTIIWKAQVPAEKVTDVREYLMTLARSEAGLAEPVLGEVVEKDDGSPDQ